MLNVKTAYSFWNEKNMLMLLAAYSIMLTNIVANVPGMIWSAMEKQFFVFNM